MTTCRLRQNNKNLRSAERRFLLFHPNDLGFGLFFVATVRDRDNGLGEVDESQACGGVAAEGSGRACVAILADALYERNLGE